MTIHRTLPLLVLALLSSTLAFGQRFLSADGVTDTYALINSVLGGTAEETPDCSHPEFGPHITQAFDSELGKHSFVFHIHVTPDDDRCINFDRQRNEIKTYGPSPDYLKGFFGDTVTFRWRFKLDGGFQPSPNFTHIHQIKAGDGPDSGAPIITLTPRFGTPDKLQLIHVGSGAVSTVVATVDLAAFKGAWVEAYEKLTYSFTGTYSIELRNLATGVLLLSYSSPNIDLWRNGTTFSRPKWGIYRSLLSQDYLRDEQVRFDRFCLAKGADDCPPSTPTEPSFSLTATPGSQTVIAGSSTSYTVTVTPSGGFTGVVTLSAAGLPNGSNASFDPPSVTTSGSSTVTVVTSSTTPAGSYPLTITGASGTLSRTANAILVVQAAGGTGDFVISASPTSQPIDPGSNVDYITTVTPSGGFSGTVIFSVSGLPAGFTATFSPSSIDGTGSSTMTVNAPDGAPASTLNLTVTGTSGALAHSTTVMLVVNSG